MTVNVCSCQGKGAKYEYERLNPYFLTEMSCILTKCFAQNYMIFVSELQAR